LSATAELLFTIMQLQVYIEDDATQKGQDNADAARGWLVNYFARSN